MQTFILRIICFCLFGFIFYCAIQPSVEETAITHQQKMKQAKSVLVANKLETKTFEVKMQHPIPLEEKKEVAN